MRPSSWWMASWCPFLPDTWYRAAMVMQLDAATSAPRYDTYLNGQPVSQIIWDQIVVDSNRNAQLKDFDLVPDGLWSVAALSATQSALPANASGFFVFNDDNGEVGELYVANLQFRDDALTAGEIAALGAAADPGAGACGLGGRSSGHGECRRRQTRLADSASRLFGFEPPHQVFRAPVGKNLLAFGRVVERTLFVLLQKPDGIDPAERCDESLETPGAEFDRFEQHPTHASTSSASSAAPTILTLTLPQRSAAFRRRSSQVAKASAPESSAHAICRASKPASPHAINSSVRDRSMPGSTGALGFCFSHRSTRAARRRIGFCLFSRSSAVERMNSSVADSAARSDSTASASSRTLGWDWSSNGLFKQHMSRYTLMVTLYPPARIVRLRPHLATGPNVIHVA